MSLYQDKDSTVGSAGALVDLIETKIADGRLAGGDRLPPIRDLAGTFDLAPNTVAKAYRLLADRGMVVTRGRAGTFVIDRPPLGLHRSPVVPPGAIDLASGTPDPRLLPDLDRFVRHHGPSSSYIDAPVLDDCERAGRRWLAGQGLDVDRLVLTSGALDAIERVLSAHLRPGDTVGVERPGWSAVTDLVSALGLRAVGIPIDERGIKPEHLARRLGSVDAVIVTPRAQNPTGAAVDAERRDALVDVLASRPDVLVVEDDHAGPVAGAELHPLGSGRDRWAFVQSVAKALGPDLRLAFVAGDRLTIDRVAGRFGIGPGWVSRILQRTVTDLLGDPDVARLLERASAEYGHRRRLLVDALTTAGLEGTTGRSGLNVWVPVVSEDAAIAASLAAGFVVRPGSEFGPGDEAVRVTVSHLDPDAIPALAGAIAGGAVGGRRLV